MVLSLAENGKYKFNPSNFLHLIPISTLNPCLQACGLLMYGVVFGTCQQIPASTRLPPNLGARVQQIQKGRALLSACLYCLLSILGFTSCQTIMFYSIKCQEEVILSRTWFEVQYINFKSPHRSSLSPGSICYIG